MTGRPDQIRPLAFSTRVKSINGRRIRGPYVAARRVFEEDPFPDIGDNQRLRNHAQHIPAETLIVFPAV